MIHLSDTVPAMTTATHSLQQRMSAGALAPAVYKAMAAFDRSIELDPQLRELVKIRASQLAQLLWAIVAINAWNRMGVATHLLPEQ